jgi:hypothetical protein
MPIPEVEPARLDGMQNPVPAITRRYEMVDRHMYKMAVMRMRGSAFKALLGLSCRGVGRLSPGRRVPVVPRSARDGCLQHLTSNDPRITRHHACVR